MIERHCILTYYIVLFANKIRSRHDVNPLLNLKKMHTWPAASGIYGDTHVHVHVHEYKGLVYGRRRKRRRSAFSRPAGIAFEGNSVFVCDTALISILLIADCNRNLVWEQCCKDLRDVCPSHSLTV